MKAKRSKESTSLIAPIHRPPRLTSFGQRCLWCAVRCHWPWLLIDAPGTPLWLRHMDLLVCRNSAAVIASQTSWQQDQHGCNQRERSLANGTAAWHEKLQHVQKHATNARARAPAIRCRAIRRSKRLANRSGAHLGRVSGGVPGLAPLCRPFVVRRCQALDAALLL
jgi:hypothetical protein